MRTLLPLSLLVAGCGAEPLVSYPTSSPAAQSYEMQIAGGARTGWALVSNDADTLSIGIVANQGFTLAGAVVCASTEPFGWVDPGTCPLRNHDIVPGSQTAQLRVSLDSLASPEALCAQPIFVQLWAPMVSAPTTFSSYAGGFKARIAYALACDPAPLRQGCVRGAREWSLLYDEMPVDGLVLGGMRYSRADLIALLGANAGNDASLAVGRELAAARLNGLAERPEWLDDAMRDADAWLEANGDRLPFGLKSTADGEPNPFAWDAGMNLASLLERFNAATYGHARCPADGASGAWRRLAPWRAVYGEIRAGQYSY